MAPLFTRPQSIQFIFCEEVREEVLTSEVTSVIHLKKIISKLNQSFDDTFELSHV